MVNDNRCGSIASSCSNEGSRKTKLRFRESVVEKDGAGDRDRTGDIQLGKLAFYR